MIANDEAVDRGPTPDQLTFREAYRYGYELAMAYVGAVVLGLIAMYGSGYVTGIVPLRMTVPQMGIYIAFSLAYLVFAAAIEQRKRWALVGALTTASLSALYFGVASLFDLLLLPFMLPHLILSGIFMTLAVAVGVRSVQGIAALSRAASLRAPGFAPVIPTAPVVAPAPRLDRDLAA